MNKKEREIVFEEIAKKNNSRSNYFIKGLFSFLLFKDLSSVEVGWLLMYVWFVVFTRSKWKMSAGRCVLLMSNHNGTSDCSEFWCSENCKTLVFCPQSRHTFLFHISVCSLTMDRPFQRVRMELVFVCCVLACSEINCVPYDKELDYDPSSPSFRSLRSNLHLSCHGWCRWPHCEKFNIALLVPGPFNLLLVLISFPSTELSPARCSSPCWEMLPEAMAAPAGPHSLAGLALPRSTCAGRKSLLF